MIGILIFTVLALIFSIGLVFLDSFLTEENQEIVKLLPGYNCGACGYKGCEDLANHIIEDYDLCHRCKFLKEEALDNMIRYLEQR